MTLSILDYRYTENQILVLDIDPSHYPVVFLKILVSKLLVQISVSSCLVGVSLISNFPAHKKGLTI